MKAMDEGNAQQQEKDLNHNSGEKVVRLIQGARNDFLCENSSWVVFPLSVKWIFEETSTHPGF